MRPPAPATGEKAPAALGSMDLKKTSPVEVHVVMITPEEEALIANQHLIMKVVVVEVFTTMKINIAKRINCHTTSQLAIAEVMTPVVKEEKIKTTAM